MKILGPDNAFWCDGEWIDWDDIIDPDEVDPSVLRRLEREDRMRQAFPKSDIRLVPYFQNLLLIARSFHETTGRHLAVYGDIGELFGAIVYGIKLNRTYAQGSDGRLGPDHVEIKTIAPHNGTGQVAVRPTGNFNKLLVVRIDRDFEVRGKMVDRKALRLTGKGPARRSWDAIDAPTQKA
ncbi:hypothetical protein [Jannaschia ovalis]|uniref:Uncharacterized protein n=1 Tax=Jannaschia ovalis TaxID=3038773 RepID=A0ABY8L8F9_9RHOB|nr:hypothetical protein [Jannaschia sp. GRR-S6-38]WGH77554.1 hypothetical protein P8627_10955 [Jannaschia sp. GRR-S6-38]